MPDLDLRHWPWALLLCFNAPVMDDAAQAGSDVAQEPRPRSQVRSYKKRSRMTPGQRAALDSLAPRFQAHPEQLSNPAELFGQDGPLVVDIGFGRGESLLASAQAHPDWNLLGIEVHTPGVGAVMRDAEAAGLANVRILIGNARDVLIDHVRADSLAAIKIFFPDPWPKARHHKRRLVDADFVALCASRLAPGGKLFMASDWAEYAQEMLDAVTVTPVLLNPHEGFAPRMAERPMTRFEAAGIAKGHQVFDLAAVRVG